MDKQVVIFGAGKIGRGFIGPLFQKNGYRLIFVELYDLLVQRLNQAKKYRIGIAGKPSEYEVVPLEEAISLWDVARISEVMESTEIMASAVGADNLGTVARTLQKCLSINRKKPLNWFICENAYAPKKTIRETLLENGTETNKDFWEEKLGLIETQVLRTGMSPEASTLKTEPLTLKMQAWCDLPFDMEAFVGEWKNLEGFTPKLNFENELLRKLYTFNGLNGPLSYMGWVKGHRYLHQVALDPDLQAFIQRIQEESAHGLLREFAFSETEHAVFQRMALDKYRNPGLMDTLERNARDPLRKLGAHERLLGPALLCFEHGKFPEAYCLAIAAALLYRGEGSRALHEKVTLEGPLEALSQLSGLPKKHPICQRSISYFFELQSQRPITKFPDFKY